MPYKDKNKQKEYYKKWRELNKDHIKSTYDKNTKTYQKSYRESNIDKSALYQKEYQEKNKSKLQKYNKSYREKNKKKRNLYEVQKRKNDSIYKITTTIRNLVGSYFRVKGFKKSNKTEQILGCTFQEFKIHIERQFESWMNWDNYGQYKLNNIRTWNIDHIIPLAQASSKEEIIKLNHYTNLRPFCSKENLDKRNKY